MKSVEIIDTFDGYPASKKVSFTKGEIVEVSDSYADILVAKGLAKETTKTGPKATARKDAQNGAE
jgi:ribosomal protein L9